MKIDLVIVDDSTLWLSIAEKLAKAHPAVANVSTFEDSFDAWIFLQVNKCNVLMTDIQMPFMSGLSFLSMFGKKIHVISTSTKIGYKPHTEKLGSIDFLSKPFSKTEFNRALTDVSDKITQPQLS